MVTIDNIDDKKKQRASVVDLTTYDSYRQSPEARLITAIHGQPIYRAVEIIVNKSGLTTKQISKLTLIGEGSNGQCGYVQHDPDSHRERTGSVQVSRMAVEHRKGCRYVRLRNDKDNAAMERTDGIQK